MGGRPSTKSKAKLQTGGQCARFITEKETEFTCAFVYYAKKHKKTNKRGGRNRWSGKGGGGGVESGRILSKYPFSCFFEM